MSLSWRSLRREDGDGDGDGGVPLSMVFQRGKLRSDLEWAGLVRRVCGLGGHSFWVSFEMFLVDTFFPARSTTNFNLGLDFVSFRFVSALLCSAHLLDVQL